MCFRRDHFKNVHNLTESKIFIHSNISGAMAKRSLNLKVEPFEWILYQRAVNPEHPTLSAFENQERWKSAIVIDGNDKGRLGLYEDKIDGHWLAVFGMRQAATFGGPKSM